MNYENREYPLQIDEHEVLGLLLNEFTLNEIALLLGISNSKVNNIIVRIKRKWKVKSLVGIALEAVQRGYVDIE